MKMFVLLLLLLLSPTAFAGEDHELLDRALDPFLPKGASIEGVDEDGARCRVSRHGRQLSVVHLAPGCIDESNGTINLECFSAFEYQYHRLDIHELSSSENELLAEITVKDSEQYSSKKSAKLEIKREGDALSVVVSNKKKLFGGYKIVLGCTI